MEKWIHIKKNKVYFEHQKWSHSGQALKHGEMATGGSIAKSRGYFGAEVGSLKE
jgi:hypothetical protein